MVILELVKNKNDVLISLHNFNREAKNNLDLTPELLIRTTYWVYDLTSNTFGPNKFVGHKNMTFEKYESALEGNFVGLRYFNGGKAKKAIEGILGHYRPDYRLAVQLINWAESITHRGVVGGVTVQKWMFNYISN
jgi:hypothetical protein